MFHTFHRCRTCLTLLASALLIVAATPSDVLAQKDSPDIPTVSNVVAIQGARIVQAPGRVIESGTVVFRDGVIEAVGRRVDIPYDASIIDGSDLSVYAGFIDALTNVGVPEPKQERGTPPSVPDRSNPTFERAGITPEKDVRVLLDPSDKSVAAHRKIGFTTVHTVPYGRMLPGMSAIALLTGEDAANMIYSDATATMFKFQGARGVYPGTPMAIMAKFRQLYKEADRRNHLESMYREDPVGMVRPPYDPVHSAFIAIIEGGQRVFTFTDDALEIHRALNLKEELGIDMVLAGLSGGFDAIDRISESAVPVALTLGIPEKPKWAAKIKKDSLDQILGSYTEETRTATFRDVEAERRNLEAKQLISRARYIGMPAAYEDAGIPFAFTSYGVKTSEIRSNIREFIEGGLSEDAALAALTTHAADLLGLSASMGTVEEGKMANLIVTAGDIFDKETKIKFVFVDGHKYEIKSPSKSDDEDKDEDEDEDERPEEDR